MKQSLSGFVLKESTYIRCGQEYVTADIFDRQSFIHIIFADIFPDQKNSRVFLRTVRNFLKKIFCFINKRLVKFTEGKTSVDCFRNSFRIAGTWNFLLMTCILKTEKKLVVQVFDRILKKFAVVGKTLEKLFQQSGCGILINIRQCLRGPWNIFRIPQSVPSENFRHESGSGGKAESVKKENTPYIEASFRDRRR